MPCCGGNCGCGAGCKSSSSSCGGCKMYPDMSLSEKTTTETLVHGVTLEKPHYGGGAEMGVRAENGGCKCGDNCTCYPCTCR